MEGKNSVPCCNTRPFIASAKSIGGVGKMARLLVAIAVLALGIGAAGAQSTVPGVIVTQVNWLYALTSGTPYTVADTAGSSFAVNSKGDVLMSNASGGQILMINGKSGAMTVLGTYGSSNTSGGVAVDSANNLYVSGLYQPYIAKIPYNNGAYAAIQPYVSGTTPTCANDGTDTAECLWLPSLTTSPVGALFGVVSMVFDAQGDFFWATPAVTGGASPYSVLECSASCIASHGAPVLLYTEPGPTTSSVTGCSGKTVQMYIGGLAVDRWGNVFFTDSAIDSCASHQSDISYLKEMVNNSGTYAAPVTLHTYTPTTIGGSDYELDAVAVDGSGTVYFTVLGGSTNGAIFGMPNSQTSANSSAVYNVSPAGIGGYLLTADASGNLYTVAYSKALNSGGVATVARLSINNLALPASPVGTQSSANATTAPVYVVDNNSSTPAVTAAVKQNGQAATEFAATMGSCHLQTLTVANSAYCSVTLSYTPATVGERLASITFTDGTSTTTATASGVGQGALVTLDPGAQTAYTTGLTSPAGIAIGSKGDIYVADKGAGKVFDVSGGTTTATGLSSPEGVAVDGNAGIYIADTGNNQILTIPYGGSQSTLISSTTSFGGATLSGPSGLAVGPNGVLYIADSGNNRVVTWGNGLPGVFAGGLNKPKGVAVDGNGNVYVANQGGGNVLVYENGVAAVTLAPTGVTAPAGVAVDSSGSVLIADAGRGSIVRVPNLAGVLTPASALTVATNPKSATGLAADISGNIFTSDGTGAAVYKIQRTQASVDLAGVYAGEPSPAVTIVAESAGSQALTVSAPTAPASSMFTLDAGAPTDCTTTTTLAVGAACELSATFTPPLGTAAGVQTTAAAFNSNAVNNTAAIITLNGTVLAGTSQTITFTPPASVNYSAGTLALSATASSGLTVSFSVVSGPGTISGSTLTITGVGTIVVAAGQLGGMNGGVDYDAAPPVTASIVVNPIGTAATPAFTPAAGTYSSAQSVAITDATAGATIYYTTDGSTPTTSSAVYGAPIPVVSSSETINAIAAAPGYTNSTVASATYTIQLPPAATPSFSPVAGTYTSVQSVTITDATAGATIYYTIDGTTPTTSSTVYSAVITVSATETIKAIAVATGYIASPVGAATYTIQLPPAATPTFSPSGGTFGSTQSVAITDTTAGATIYYTTDGTTPTTSSTVYSAAVTVSATETIKAIATAPGYSASAVASATYAFGVPTFTLALSPTTLTISPGGQVYATVTVTPMYGFNSAVTFSCSGMPLGTVCTFNPTTVTPNGSAATTQVAVTAGVLAANQRQGFRAPLGGLLACLIGGFIGFRRRRNLWMLALAAVCSLAGIGALNGCGGGAPLATSSTTVTVSAVSGPITQNATFTLNIQ